MGKLALKKIGIFFLPLSVTLLFSFLNPTSTVSQDSFHKKIILREATGTRLPPKVKHLTAPEKPVGAVMIMIKSPTDTTFSRAERMEPVKSPSVIHSTQVSLELVFRDVWKVYASLYGSNPIGQESEPQPL